MSAIGLQDVFCIIECCRCIGGGSSEGRTTLFQHYYKLVVALLSPCLAAASPLNNVIVMSGLNFLSFSFYETVRQTILDETAGLFCYMKCAAKPLRDTATTMHKLV